MARTVFPAPGKNFLDFRLGYPVLVDVWCPSFRIDVKAKPHELSHTATADPTDPIISRLLVLKRIAFEFLDEITHFLARTYLAFEQRLQQRLEMHAQRHRQDRRRIALQSRYKVVELVETLLDVSINGRWVCERHARLGPPDVRPPYTSQSAIASHGARGNVFLHKQAANRDSNQCCAE